MYSLCWSKVPVELKDNYVSELTDAISSKLWNGSMDKYEPTKVSRELIPFLEGVAFGGKGSQITKDAERLIIAIESNGEVILKLKD